ncbi:MAG: MarR family winged helix-turn-helix transcriptional regulator [Polaromonas sp.]
MAKSFNFSEAPGHLIRRAQQLAVAIFMEETAGFDATPVQFAILNALMDDPGEDQITLSGRVAFDPATFGSVIGRLEAKGWVMRQADPGDKRRKLLWITPEGEQVALQMKRAVSRAQQRIVGPLDADERVQLGVLLGKLIAGHEDAANKYGCAFKTPNKTKTTAKAAVVHLEVKEIEPSYEVGSGVSLAPTEHEKTRHS